MNIEILFKVGFFAGEAAETTRGGKKKNQTGQKSTQPKPVFWGLVQVEAPHPNINQEQTMAVIKDTLEQACLNKVQHWFMEAAQSPLLQLSEEKGWEVYRLVLLNFTKLWKVPTHIKTYLIIILDFSSNNCKSQQGLQKYQ